MIRMLSQEILLYSQYRIRCYAHDAAEIQRQETRISNMQTKISNANLLLFNPLVLLALVPMLRRVGAAVFAGGIAVAYLLLLFPKHQYNLDVLVLVTPVNLAVAGFLLHRKS